MQIAVRCWASHFPALHPDSPPKPLAPCERQPPHASPTRSNLPARPSASASRSPTNPSCSRDTPFDPRPTVPPATSSVCLASPPALHTSRSTTAPTNPAAVPYVGLAIAQQIRVRSNQHAVLRLQRAVRRILQLPGESRRRIVNPQRTLQIIY